MHASGRYGVSNPRSFVVVTEPVVLIPDDGSSEAKKLTPGAVSVGKLRKHDRVTFALNGGSIQSLVLRHPRFRFVSVAENRAEECEWKHYSFRSNHRSQSNRLGLDPNRGSAIGDIGRSLPRWRCICLCHLRNPKSDNPLKNASPDLPASALVSFDLPIFPIVAANRQPNEKGPLRVTPPVEIVANNPRDLLVQWNDGDTPMELQVFSNSIGQPTDFRALAYRPSKDSSALGSPFQTSEKTGLLLDRKGCAEVVWTRE